MPDSHIRETAATEAVVTRTHGSRGYQGERRLFKISTLVLGPDYDPETKEYSEKEIDVDERSARLQITIEMSDQMAWRYRATHLHVELHLNDLAKPEVTALDQNIAINDQSTGKLVLFDRADNIEIFPGQALHRIVTVKTGVFSTLAYNRQAATAGEKEFPVTVTFDLEPFDPSAEGYSRNKAFIIVSAD